MAIRVNDIIVFGRQGGEQTLARVKKVNRTTYAVELLERRGNGRPSNVGAIWRVHKSLRRESSADERRALFGLSRTN